MSVAQRLILASGSRTRRMMLEHSGLVFQIVPAAVDEPAIRDLMVTDNPGVDPADVAEVLARAKAEMVSEQHPDALVIGADQVLACEGALFEKAADRDGARDALWRLRGRTHTLYSAVILAERGAVTWSHVETADLTMRAFSDQFLESYLDAAGDAVTQSVGAYQVEGLGLQLFNRIDGDFNTILGLPMLVILAELRRRGVIAA